MFCRIRPMFEKGTPMFEQGFSSTELSLRLENRSSDVLDSASTASHDTMTSRFSIASAPTFEFDQIFDGSTSQAAVYQEISPLIDSFLSGSDVCIFAYGQTGSGKTYTLQGESRILSTIEPFLIL